MKTCIVRRIKTPDGTILNTKYTHDFLLHKDANGEEYMLDGGPCDYYRTSVNKEPAEDISVYNTDPFDTIRNALEIWDGNNFVYLKDISDQNLFRYLQKCFNYPATSISEINIQVLKEFILRYENSLKSSSKECDSK